MAIITEELKKFNEVVECLQVKFQGLLFVLVSADLNLISDVESFS